MEQQPKVSVITPVYNTEKYLRQCLDSVVGQTLQDIEIICVNDGSHDGSLAILEEYAEKDARITVISQNNKGLSAARNLGLSHAVGEYVYMIDSDDYLELDALEILYRKCIEKDLDLVFFDLTAFYDADPGQLCNPPSYRQRREYSGVYGGVAFMKMLKDDRAYMPNVYLVLIRRDFLLENRITFYEGIIHEDDLFSFQLLMEAGRVSHVGRSFYHRRFRPGSIMTVPKSHKNVVGYYISMQEMMKYGLSSTWDGEKSAEIWRAFQEKKRSSRNLFSRISDGERAQITFENPFSQLLFDAFILEGQQSDDSARLVKKQQARIDDSARLIKKQQARIDDSARLIKKQQARIHALETEISNIHVSVTYKVGRFITFIPRKIRGGIRCYRENGLRYTIGRVKYKLKRLLGVSK